MTKGLCRPQRRLSIDSDSGKAGVVVNQPNQRQHRLNYFLKMRNNQRTRVKSRLKSRQVASGK
jgi:hypothetical protein